MKMNHLIILCGLLLTACSQEPAGIRVVSGADSAPNVTKAKTEPIFYNGKTYQVSVAPAPDGAATIQIAGMGPAQARDASGLATSALHHFTCRDSQKAVLNAAPAFAGGTWQATGHCA